MFFQVNRSIDYRYKNRIHVLNYWAQKIIRRNNFFMSNKYERFMWRNQVSICKIRNRCIINGKARSVNCRYKISRIFFKSLSQTGALNGILKK